MDSMQPILPSERIRIYGVDRSWDEETSAKHKKQNAIKILDEQITYRCDGKEIGLRWLSGAHPELGTIIHGCNGFETIQKFQRIYN